MQLPVTTQACYSGRSNGVYVECDKCGKKCGVCRFGAAHERHDADSELGWTLIEKK
ncbi:unnamed protein product [Ceratitis capitata]|uniref:(Mediterranean fruit fly) hypothetical protein n=1 Tax=Ceratitis capitata TaxID=7213 RepID=A0A811U8X3_CERCA|nr:unnamed protein product [Ceratitis capitata]